MKLNIQGARDKVIALHRNRRSGLAVVRALTQAYDRIVTDVFSAVPGSATSTLSIVALGGYGRRELCFASDIDLMILAPSEGAKRDQLEVMQVFFHRLLDEGLDIGHSFRTIDDCLDLRRSNLDIWLSLLDARFVCGDTTTFRRFSRSVQTSAMESDRAAFVRELLALQDARHDKYGRSSKLLEPNIKNSAGGLRDVQTIGWIFTGAGLERFGAPKTRGTLENILTSRSVRGLVPAGVPSRAVRALDFILRVRNEMHLSAGALHDTLEFSTQSKIAANLRYRTTATSSSVERFMRDYFDATNSIAELSARVGLWARDRWLGPSGVSPTRRIGDRLRLRSGKIELAKPRAELPSTVVLEAIHASTECGAEFSFQLEDAIHRRLRQFRPLRSKEESSLFLELFKLHRGAADSLRLMNRLGLLERWLPEWRPLVRFFQHNQYHFYTADEHTLNVLSSAEHLRDESSAFGEACRALPRFDTLSFACLFHDIAKPDRIEDHEVGGARIAAAVLRRLGANDIAEDVAFLVRHHLFMEQTAFRRNLSDPTTVQEFASRFQRPDLLDYLFVLTRADLSSVNSNVWTEWKAALLTELYHKSRAVLRPDAAVSRPQPSTSLVSRLERTFGPEELAAHASLLEYDGYRTAFSPDEIVGHIRTVSSFDGIAVLVQHWTDVTEVTVVTRDAPFLLARCCGVLSANDANIIDAQIFTRDDGIVIDKFRVVEAVTHSVLSEERCRKIGEDLREVFAGRTDLAHLIERHRRKWKRKAGRRNPNIRIDVEFEEHPLFTIIDVFGADTLGFLYRVTETISGLGLSIHFAKISTRGDGIVDSFYVLDRNGGRLEDAKRKEEVKQKILVVLRELSESTLT